MAFTVTLAVEGSRTLSAEGVAFTDTWLVESDNSTSTRTQAEFAWLTATGYGIGVPHGEDAGAVLGSVTTTRTKDDRQFFTVAATFGPLSLRNDETNTPPENRRIKRSWRSHPITREVTKDRDGTLIANTAGSPFDPPPSSAFYHGVAIFQRYLTEFDDDDAMSYVGHVNASTFFGKPAEKVICQDIVADEEYIGGTLYYNVTYMFEYAPEGWTVDSLSYGTMEKDADGNLVNIKDEEGNFVMEPQPLDADGKKTTADNAASVSFNVLPTANFDDLGLS